MESSKQRPRSFRTVATSVLFHAGLLGLAVHTTARATTPVEGTTVYRVPLRAPSMSPASEPADVKGDGTSAVQEPPAMSSTALPPAIPQMKVPAFPSDLVPAEIPLPSTGAAARVGLDISGLPNSVGITAAGSGPGFGPKGGGAGPGAGDGSQGPYDIHTVDQAAYLDPRAPRPRYPEVLQTAQIEGAVMLEFVIDTLGRVEMGTVRVLSADHELFVASVRVTLPKLRFYPAKVAGRPVRQLVRLPFTFSIK